jgi:hypothetical protein
MKTRVQFCPSCNQYPAEARLARVLEQIGLELSVEFDKEAPPGKFTVYLGDEPISSGYEQEKLSDRLGIPCYIKPRISGDIVKSEAEHGPV